MVETKEILRKVVRELKFKDEEQSNEAWDNCWFLLGDIQEMLRDIGINVKIDAEQINNGFNLIVEKRIE